MISNAQQQETAFSKAASLINEGDLAAAELILENLTRNEPDHSAGHYLLGLIAVEHQGWKVAEVHLRKALQHAPEQPKVCTLLARTIRALGRPDEALALCLSASGPDSELQLELARCHEALGELEAAAAVYQAALLDDPCPDAALCVSQFLCRVSRPAEAELVLRPFLTENSKIDENIQVALRQQLGRTLKLQKRYDKAISELSITSEHGMQDRSCVIERAGLLAQLGRFEEAAEAYRAFLDHHPLALDIHTLLNEAYYVLGQHERIGTSYDNSLATVPDAGALAVAKGRLFLKLGRLEGAEAAFRAALRIAPGDPSAMAGLAQSLEQAGQFEAAHEIHQRNVSNSPTGGMAWESFGQFLLLHDDPRLAVKALKTAVQLRPTSQSGLAMLGLAYRASGDALEQWLNDYDRDVQVFDLPPPEGYRDMESFNAELSNYLRTLHAEGRQYLFQTLRGGTQTHDEIFYQGHRLIDLLLVRINSAIQKYRDRLAGRFQHPFASRLGRNFRHIGSWSSCLKSDGYHVNHIHQKGWISSCYYVSVPDVTTEGRQGGLKFGEPPVEFGLNWSARRFVQPKVGRLVLFPSYLWHGTQAFHADEQRITIAFDTVPA